MEFVSSAASVFVTWDVIWILVTSTFFSNLHMVREYIYMAIQTCEMNHECLGTLGSSMFLFFFLDVCRKVKTTSVILSYSTIQQNKGNPTKASGMLMI